MERIKITVIICVCLFVTSGQSSTIEELSPLLETLKAGIRIEILSEITSITTELSKNVITTGEIVGIVQKQQEVIRHLTKELNETRLLLKDAIELNQKEQNILVDQYHKFIFVHSLDIDGLLARQRKYYSEDS